MSGVTCITHNCGRLAGEAGGVNVLQGGEWSTNNPSSCVHYALQGFPIIFSAASAPHSDTAGEDALNGASVECGHDGWWSTCPSEFSQEVEAALGFLRQWCSVGGPGEVFTDVHPQEFGAAHSLHSSTVDGQWQVLGVTSLEVNNNLLGFADVQQEVVIPAPRGQKVDLHPVLSLIALGDETHQSCVVSKFHYVIVAVGCSAVMRQ